MIRCNFMSGNTVFIVLIYYACMGGMGCPQLMAEEGKTQTESACNIHETYCVKALRECTVALDINPKPVKAMADLDFTVTLSGKKPSSNPHIALGMPGMQMGSNRVKLKDMGNNTYQGKGIIVRCPSGRRTWKAVVTVPDVGVAEFVFDVVY